MAGPLEQSPSTIFRWGRALAHTHNNSGKNSSHPVQLLDGPLYICWSNEASFSVTAVSVLAHFRLTDLSSRLARDGIHGLRNFPLLDPSYRFYFNTPLLWIERNDTVRRQWSSE